MKLFIKPGACSLSPHIILEEAGLPYETEVVDLAKKVTASGADYLAINPKGYVPALVLDNGEVLTENVAILAWISDEAPAALATPTGALGRIRLLEALAFVSTELHKAFGPYFASGASDEAKDAAAKLITRRLGYLSERLTSDFLFGDRLSVADCYLFVMLTWARKNHVPVPSALSALYGRMSARPSVQKALAHEAETRSKAA